MNAAPNGSNQTEEGRHHARRFQDTAVSSAFSYVGDFQLAEDTAQDAFTVAYFTLNQLPAYLRDGSAASHTISATGFPYANWARGPCENIGDPPALLTAADRVYQWQELRRLVLDLTARRNLKLRTEPFFATSRPTILLSICPRTFFCGQ